MDAYNGFSAPVVVVYGSSTLANSLAPRAESSAKGLSPRQCQVLDLMVKGQSNKEIARALKIAEGTVKIHVAGLFQKLGVHRRAAVAVASGTIQISALT